MHDCIPYLIMYGLLHHYLPNSFMHDRSFRHTEIVCTGTRFAHALDAVYTQFETKKCDKCTVMWPMAE